MRIALVIVCALLTSLWLGSSAEAGHGKAQVQTVANVSAIAPGQPFMLGFKFSIAPGWHIYWKNPGDSGLATQIKLSLPAGFSAGEILFPVPTRLQLPGDIVNYAYEDQVMLMVRITPPKDLPSGRSVDLNGKVSWLVCNDECIPGKADVSLRLPVAETSAPANADLFEEWIAKLPDQEGKSPDIVTSGHSMDINEGDCRATITIVWKSPPSDVQFIPGPMKADVNNIKISTDGTTSKVTFLLRGYKSVDPVLGLVTFASSAGALRGIDISTPLVTDLSGADETEPGRKNR